MAKYTYYKHTSTTGKVFFYRVDNKTRCISSDMTGPGQPSFSQNFGVFEKITATQMALEMLGEEKKP